MTIEVVYFSVLREIAGAERESLELSLSPAPTVAIAIAALHARHPGLASWEDRLLVAVNCHYAQPDEALAEGDELALMPPVQGG